MNRLRARRTRTHTSHAAPILVLLAMLALNGCQRDAPSPAAPPAPATTQAAAPVRPPAPAPQPATAPAPDLDALPVSVTPLPPFPYIDYPDGLEEKYRQTSKADFDVVPVIVGERLHEVEGRVEERMFSNSNAKLSAIAARRNYENLIKQLGAVKVNTVGPDDARFVAAYGKDDTLRIKKLRLPGPVESYDTYVVRMPDNRRAWLVLMLGETTTKLMSIEEKAMEQTVGLVKAEAMRAALAKDGRIALYINFDTDKATIRPDGKPAVEEIVKLMKNDPALKLSIEGHTDNSGTAAHNRDLSQRRADVVVATLIAAGIDKARLSAVGLGDSKPLADNGDEAGRARNRRVELVKQP